MSVGLNGFLDGPDDAKAAVRNHVMRSMGADDWYRQLNWLYGSNGLDAAAATDAAA